jgi:hypothetical protein
MRDRNARNNSAHRNHRIHGRRHGKTRKASKECSTMTLFFHLVERTSRFIIQHLIFNFRDEEDNGSYPQKKLTVVSPTPPSFALLILTRRYSEKLLERLSEILKIIEAYSVGNLCNGKLFLCDKLCRSFESHRPYELIR